jgi:hypothetical protein
VFPFGLTDAAGTARQRLHLRQHAGQLFGHGGIVQHARQTDLTHVHQEDLDLGRRGAGLEEQVLEARQRTDVAEVRALEFFQAVQAGLDLPGLFVPHLPGQGAHFLG